MKNQNFGQSLAETHNLLDFWNENKNNFDKSFIDRIDKYINDNKNCGKISAIYFRGTLQYIFEHLNDSDLLEQMNKANL